MKKDRNKVVERLRNNIRPENRIFIRKNLAISEQVQYILQQKGWTQKDLARTMGKHESEVSKWLTGLHNLTIQSISLMEAVLETEIIITPLDAYNKYRQQKYKKHSVDSLVNEESISKKLK